MHFAREFTISSTVKQSFQTPFGKNPRPSPEYTCHLMSCMVAALTDYDSNSKQEDSLPGPGLVALLLTGCS